MQKVQLEVVQDGYYNTGISLNVVKFGSILVIVAFELFDVE